MLKKTQIILMTGCFTWLLISCNTGQKQDESLYLITYFVNEKDGMHMAVSEDGLNWLP